MKKKSFDIIIFGITIGLLILSCTSNLSVVKYADPRNATERPGNCVIGPQVPWGSINPSPNTPEGSTDGYTKSNPILGFAQTHVHGTGGGSRYGNFLITPVKSVSLDKKYIGYQKKDEKVNCGYYEVTFNNNINTKITAAHHSAIYQITFPEHDSAFLQLDLSHYLPRHIQLNNGFGILEGEIHYNAEKNTISGYGKYLGGWTGLAPNLPFDLYFVAKPDCPIVENTMWKGSQLIPGAEKINISSKFDSIGCIVKLKPKRVVNLKIAVSFKSIEQAQIFLDNEIPGFAFNKVLSENNKAWAKQLKKIQVLDKSATSEQLTIFYSNLYHTLVMPRDRTAENLYGNHQPYWDDHYAIWDTYRTVFPLHNLLNESMSASVVNSFISRYERQPGYVSDVFIAGKEGGPQGGDNVDVVIADAFVKQVKGIDWLKAWKIMKYHADEVRDSFYRASDHGWIAHNLAGSAPRSGSRTVEFNYNDFCTHQLAKGLGFETEATRYLTRSGGWKNLWDRNREDTGFRGFISPRNSNGTWVNFDPRERHGWRSHFYEGTSWQYSFYVPHQMEGLIEACGGRDIFEKRADAYFSSNFHAWSNEPTFLVPFVYYYLGKPWKSADIIALGKKQWTITGAPGNDDSGAMGAWYVFASIGLFPVAGQDIYFLCPPSFSKTLITRENGKKITIETLNLSSENRYIQNVTWNGKSLGKSWIEHTELIKGGTLVFEMGNQPSSWGSQNIPPSYIQSVK